MDKDPDIEAQAASPNAEKPDLSSTQPSRPVNQDASQDQTQPHPLTHETEGHRAKTPLNASGKDQSALPLQALTPVNQAGEAPPQELPTRRSWRWAIYALLGLLLLGGIALVSAYGGYLSAIELRLNNEATQAFSEAQRQFELGMQDLQAQRYDLARQRFEYVIRINPNYPGVTEALAQALLALNTTATPTLVPTPTLSPTPDLRGQEELYLQAREFMAGGDWTAAIDTLLLLRKRFPDYLTVEVDGLLYMALRNRGVQKIAQQADLEGGTYDLALAASFGPLDVEARNWRDWAVLYVRGASFWDVDWEQAVYYFSQLAQIAPNLMDASRLTAVERYYLALVGYGDWLARQERWCDAANQYQLAANLRSDPEVAPTAAFIAEQCANPPQETSGGVATLTPTLTPTFGAIVSPTPPTPTATEAPPPTDTPPPPETPTSTPGG